MTGLTSPAASTTMCAQYPDRFITLLDPHAHMLARSDRPDAPELAALEASLKLIAIRRTSWRVSRLVASQCDAAICPEFGEKPKCAACACERRRGDCHRRRKEQPCCHRGEVHLIFRRFRR